MNKFLRKFGICLLGIAFFLLTLTPAKATNYYSRVNGGLWTSAASWSTVTYGNATNTGTYPQAGDNAYIGDGYIIYFNTNLTVGNIFVGQGSSGELQFYNLAVYWLTVTGDITIYNGAKFRYNFNSSRTHQVYLNGNLINNGEVDFYYDSNDLVNLTFQGNTNSVVSGVGAWDLNAVSMVKTVTKTNYLEVQDFNFESAIRTLNLTYGTFIHNNSGTYVFGSAADYTLVANINIDARDGTLNFAPTSTYLNLQGGLYVSGGTVNVGATTGTGGIRSDQQIAGIVPYLEVSSGLLRVYGSISFKVGSFAEPFGFRQTGGDILVNCGSTGVSTEVFYITDLAASSFTMSGGTITIEQNNTTGASIMDFFFCGNTGTVNVTGGVVQFGDASTANNSSFNFKPFPNATYPAFRVSGASGSNNKLMPSNGSTSNFRLLGLEIEAGTSFDIRSISGAAGNTKSMSLRGTVDGINAFISDGTFICRSSTVTLEGTTQQDISGSTMPVFYNLTMNNSAGSTLSTPIYIYNYLNMTVGIITSSYTNLVNIGSSANANVGNSSSYIIGPMNQIYRQTSAASGYFPLGKGSNWRPMVLTPSHSTNDSVNYIGEMIETAASSLGYTLPASLSAVSNKRYWLITNTKSSIFNSATIQLYYGSDDGVTDRLNLRVAEGIGTNWFNRGGTGTANGTGTITSSSFNAWGSVFTLANATGGSNALPIELLGFSAQKYDKDVRLDWTTAAEINNDYFTVERSADNNEYVPLEIIRGAGNSTSIINYNTFDKDPLFGVSYYRLKQTDYDGVFTYSDPVKIEFGRKPGISVSPNPVSGQELNIQLNEIHSDHIEISLKRSDGALVYREEINGRRFDGNLHLNGLDLSRNGMYVLTVMADGQFYQEKLITLP
ncbi:MAG: hypothetical protein U0073_14210 [Bacteroidia bacterium]